MNAPGQIFDRLLHRRRLDRAAGSAGAADFLRRRAAEDLAERLALVNRRFPIALEIGARHGAFGRVLALGEAIDKVDLLVQSDLSAAMLSGRSGARVAADEVRLPFAPGSLDLVVSCLALHWVGDLVGALIQLRRALKPDGLLLVAFLGGSTLIELRRSLLEGEAELTGGAGPRVSPFADAFDAAGLLQRAGFALPVVDIDKVVVRYDHPLQLIADLRAMGETNVLVDRPGKPLTRRSLGRAWEVYADRFSGPDGRISATFEILTLTGWAPHPGQPRPLRPGSAKVRLADALGAEKALAEPAPD
ncbi:MAG TPA: methyltransferase domain-containing protein [Caulobacteraceae bacterium]|nr:methyltransferase domain-containing protein [Caulobacteraceae bacterium]